MSSEKFSGKFLFAQTVLSPTAMPKINAYESHKVKTLINE